MRSSATGSIVPLLGLIAVIGLCYGQQDFTEKKLVLELLGTYGSVGRYGRPVTNSSVPINVTQGFSLIQLLDFDQLNQVLTIVGTEYMSWKDPVLTWEPSEYDDYTSVVLPTQEIWTPDVVLFNALDRPIVVHDSLCRVTSEGQVVWVTNKQYKVTCVTNPDESDPNCLLKFGSWTMSTDKINLIRDRNKINAGYYVSHHDWELGRTKAVKSNKEYPCCTGVYSDITYSIDLHLRVPKTDESDQDLAGAICPRISSGLLFMSALCLLLLF